MQGPGRVKGLLIHGCEAQAVGMDAAKMAAQNMQMLLPGGGAASALSAHPDTVTSIIAGMSRPELYAIISQATHSPSFPLPLPAPSASMSCSELYAIVSEAMLLHSAPLPPARPNRSGCTRSRQQPMQADHWPDSTCRSASPDGKPVDKCMAGFWAALWQIGCGSELLLAFHHGLDCLEQ